MGRHRPALLSFSTMSASELSKPLVGPKRQHRRVVTMLTRGLRTGPSGDRSRLETLGCRVCWGAHGGRLGAREMGAWGLQNATLGCSLRIRGAAI